MTAPTRQGAVVARRIYVANASYGSYRIASVEVVKETPKQFLIDPSTEKRIVGRLYLPKRVNKDDYHTSGTLREAQEWCLNFTKNKAAQLQEQLDQANKQIEELEAELAEGVTP